MRVLIALTLLGMFVAANASAQSLPAVRKAPFSRLFTDDPAPAVVVPPIAPPVDVVTAVSKQSPIVVCGMTLVPVDPGIDPKIQFRAPADARTPVIKIVEPTACR